MIESNMRAWVVSQGKTVFDYGTNLRKNICDSFPNRRCFMLFLRPKGAKKSLDKADAVIHGATCSGSTFSCGQRTSATLAGGTYALPCVLHAHLGFMTQHGGTLLPRSDSQQAPARSLPKPRTLIMAIGEYIDGHNQKPKSFTWTAKANDILEKVTRAQTALNKILSA